jgi:hypothetical protein
MAALTSVSRPARKPVASADAACRNAMEKKRSVVETMLNEVFSNVSDSDENFGNSLQRIPVLIPGNRLLP